MTTRDERHQQIVEILRTSDSATVADLGVRLGVAEMTIRRDLELLESEGVLSRFHGGARLTHGSSYEPPLAVREKTNLPQKQAIARAAVDLIHDGDTVIVDGGSTGLAIAEALADRRVKVCPLSLRIAWNLSQSSTIDLIIPPGRVRQNERSLIGDDTVAFLLDHRFDHYIMSLSGFSIEAGLTEWNQEDAAVKRAALRASRTTTAVVDSSKFGSEGFVVVCSLDTPSTVITDDGLSVTQQNELRAHARSVTIAETG